MKNIKKLIVHYENGQTDEWDGHGWLTRTDTHKKVETEEKDHEGKPKLKEVHVKSIEAQIFLEVRPE